LVDASEVWAPAGGSAIRQCEVLSEATQFFARSESLGTETLTLDGRIHTWVMVLTQDCDCDWDFAARSGIGEIEGHHKEVPNLLFCEALTEDELRARPQVKSDIWRRIRDNQDERFHTLPEIPAQLDARGQGVPELVLDFKRCFSVPTSEIYKQMELNEPGGLQRRAYLLPPFRDQASTRAFGFHGRIATPE
jgi:hypothetical protein